MSVVSSGFFKLKLVVNTTYIYVAGEAFLSNCSGPACSTSGRIIGHDAAMDSGAGSALMFPNYFGETIACFLL